MEVHGRGGAVVTPAQELLTFVPSEETSEVEATVLCLRIRWVIQRSRMRHLRPCWTCAIRNIPMNVRRESTPLPASATFAASDDDVTDTRAQLDNLIAAMASFSPAETSITEYGPVRTPHYQLVATP